MNDWLSCALLYRDVRYTCDLVRKGLPASQGIEADLFRFLEAWFDDSPTLTVHTSGSTGAPKPITVRKVQMMNSARNTCDFLHLQPSDRALLCMPLRYIAGKMVVVRALVRQMELLVAEPSGHPMADINEEMDFAAIVPLQLFNTLCEEEERIRLMAVHHLIVGGGAVSPEMVEQLQSFPHAVYSTYGMTETVSHIALRRLNGREASDSYTPFANVRLSLSADRTLVIDAPDVCDTTLVTNDVVELRPDGSFIVIGRKDNTINSGGIKMQTETIERTLAGVIEGRFAITSVPDPKLGEAVVLLFEGAGNEMEILSRIRPVLPKYQCPKRVFFVPSIPQTETGKIGRHACKVLALKACNGSK